MQRPRRDARRSHKTTSDILRSWSARAAAARRPAERGQAARAADPGAADPGAAAWPRRLTAEAFGTFWLVFVAVSGGEVSVAARAVAPGLMVAALFFAIGDVSGAHLNPAVSLAFTLKRLFPVRWLVPYWGSQRRAGGGGPLGAAARR